MRIWSELVSVMEKELILISAFTKESYTEVIFTAESRFFYVCYLSVWTKTVSIIFPCYVYTSTDQSWHFVSCCQQSVFIVGDHNHTKLKVATMLAIHKKRT